MIYYFSVNYLSKHNNFLLCRYYTDGNSELLTYSYELDMKQHCKWMDFHIGWLAIK